jgi:hypothetical protein
MSQHRKSTRKELENRISELLRALDRAHELNSALQLAVDILTHEKRQLQNELACGREDEISHACRTGQPMGSN